MKDHGVFSIKLLILSDHLPKAAASCSNQEIPPFFLGLGLRPIHTCTSNSYNFCVFDYHLPISNNARCCLNSIWVSFTLKSGVD